MAMIKPPTTGEEIATRRRNAQAIGEVIDGHGNNGGSFVIASTATSTAVTDLKVGPDSIICLMPTNAAGATEFGAGTLYVSARGQGTFTVTSLGTAAARNFSYAILATGHSA